MDREVERENGGGGVEDLKKIVARKCNESRREVVDRKVVEKRLVDAEKY